jgi:hypothetical protein
MVDKLQLTKNSRRQFFSSLLSNKKEEKVKLLTPDGKLVEVDRSVVDAGQRKKVNNRDIYDWMNNPSKD